MRYEFAAQFFSFCANTSFFLQTEIISSKGYPVEERYVITEDGYVLTVFRIPFGRTGRGNQRRPVVFLQHGLLCSAADWVINLPHQSLGEIQLAIGHQSISLIVVYVMRCLKVSCRIVSQLELLQGSLNLGELIHA
ncbi:hypothetical protein HPB48_011011 [Haemaphysalis longicornis]|uniref:Partial AB-hydrolase lipase domain-containing protein n=1 Tax=Haemaphysalis longicornis TaxID=44386 RepID=A0A9J6GPB9_HAELO|nr:hypothetical protein HPB48_011011 [Haemaphysalis longicornis]